MLAISFVISPRPDFARNIGGQIHLLMNQLASAACGVRLVVSNIYTVCVQNLLG